QQHPTQRALLRQQVMRRGALRRARPAQSLVRDISDRHRAPPPATAMRSPAVSHATDTRAVVHTANHEPRTSGLPQATSSVRAAQHTLWITLWKGCVQPGSVCADGLWTTRWRASIYRPLICVDRDFTSSPSCGWDSTSSEDLRLELDTRDVQNL